MIRFITTVLLIASILILGSDAESLRRRKERPAHLPKPVAGQRELVELGGVEYYFALDVAINFFDAQAECANLNMTLLSLQSLEKHQMFIDFLDENPSYDSWLWTSGHRAINENSWTWSSTNEPFTYLGWAVNEPDVAEDLEDCADFSGLLSSGAWEDDECDLWEMSYICEPIKTIE